MVTVSQVIGAKRHPESSDVPQIIDLLGVRENLPTFRDVIWIFASGCSFRGIAGLFNNLKRYWRIREGSYLRSRYLRNEAAPSSLRRPHERPIIRQRPNGTIVRKLIVSEVTTYLNICSDKRDGMLAAGPNLVAFLPLTSVLEEEKCVQIGVDLESEIRSNASMVGFDHRALHNY